jgi:hypothetical protein
VRDGNIKHGLYAQEPTEALCVLGKDPKDFEKLLESLQATWQPANELEGQLVKRLARAGVRAERNDRVQESMAVRQVRENQNMQNEGDSHDVVDNKGYNFISHDVIDNKGS